MNGFGRIDGERGSAPWWLGLLSGFEALRSDEVGEVWEAAEQRYRQRGSRGWGYKNGQFTLKTVRPPRVYSMVHSADASLLYSTPKFFSRPTSEQYADLSSVAEDLVNGMWQRYVADNELQMIVRDAVKYGRGWGIVGYEDDYSKAKKARARRRREALQAQADPMFRILPTEAVVNPIGGEPPRVENELEPTTYERDERALWKKPSFRRVSPWDVFFDPDAPVPEKMRWCARRIVADVESVRNDPRFAKAKGIENLQPTLALDGRGVSKTRYGQRTGILSRGISALSKAFTSLLGQGVAQNDYTYVELFEVHYADEDGKWGIKYVANGFPEFLYESDELYDIGCPLSSLAWNGDGDTLFTTSDVEQVMTQILEEENLRTRLHYFMLRRADQPTLLDKRMFGGSAGNLEMLTNPKVGSYALVEGLPSGQPLQTGVAELPKKWELGETLAYLERLEKEFADATGLGPSQRLQAMKSDTSAAEANNVNQASTDRLSDKQRHVNRFYVDIAYKLLGLGAQFLEAEELAALLSDEQVARWRATTISAGDIQDGLHLYIEKGSTAAPSEERRASFYQLAMQLWQDPVLGQKFDGDEILDRLARMSGVPDLDRIMVEGVDVDELRNQMMMQSMMGAAPSGPAGAAAPAEAGAA